MSTRHVSFIDFTHEEDRLNYEFHRKKVRANVFGNSCHAVEKKTRRGSSRKTPVEQGNEQLELSTEFA